MKEATRSEIWLLLCEAFSEILQAIRCSAPNTTMKCGRYWNEAFAFRAYAEFINEGHTVVISFNIQLSTSQIKIWGDIARENGLVLKDLTQTTLDGISGESQVVDVARGFASLCKEEAMLICQELT